MTQTFTSSIIQIWVLRQLKASQTTTTTTETTTATTETTTTTTTATTTMETTTAAPMITTQMTTQFQTSRQPLMRLWGKFFKSYLLRRPTIPLMANTTTPTATPFRLKHLQIFKASTESHTTMNLHIRTTTLR